MDKNLKCCMDCINFRTKKVYTVDGKYRVSFCSYFKKDLAFDKQCSCYKDAMTCIEYLEV